MRIRYTLLLLLSTAAVACSASEPIQQSESTKSVKTGLSARCMMLEGGTPVRGTWEDITPPQINLAMSAYGVKAFVVDPNDSATVYLGTGAQGIYKSSDCGSTWSHVNTGINGSKLDQGRNWTMVIDPTDSSIYTSSGYGPSGVWKSTNGGVDWTQILTPNVTSVAPYGGFIGWIAMEPSDPNHLVVNFHGTCSPPAPSACMAETHDRGTTWTLTSQPLPWNERDTVYILSGATWLYATMGAGTGGGIWRTVDSGAHWSQVSTTAASQQIYRSPVTGHLFVGGGTGISESANNGVTWTTTQQTRTFSMTGNGTTLFASNGPCSSASVTASTTPYLPYFSASESTPKWSKIASPLMKQGGMYLAYNTDQQLLYSSNCLGGFWRAWVGP